MKLRFFWPFLILLLAACATRPVSGEEPPVQTECGSEPDYQVNFCLDLTDFPNPERGFHDNMELAEDRAIWRATPQTTLVRSYVLLDDWRSADLPQELFDDLDRGFEVVRRAGMKVVLRFAYNFGDGPDTELSQVLRHIEQLTPVLRRNSDVIAVLQAGFIGKWGEWHNEPDDEFGLTKPENKRAIGLALLDAMPADRSVQFRTPYHMYHVLDSREPFNPDRAFGSSDVARMGFVNDCFLASDDDAGTYGSGDDRAYARAMTPYTPTGGETCDIPAQPVGRQDCPNALAELEAYHWDYLNLEYYEPVLDGWRGDCFGEISRRLGYRYDLIGASLEQKGDDTVLTLGVRNSGFGKLYNPRPLQLLLVNGGDVRRITLAADARQVMPLSGETITDMSFRLPDLPAGRWELELALPDAALGLADNPAYSIRLAALDGAGESVWNGLRGSNRLGLELLVAPD